MLVTPSFWTRDEFLRDAIFQTPNESALPQEYFDHVLNQTYRLTHVERARSFPDAKARDRRRPREAHVVFVLEEKQRHVLGSTVYDVGDDTVVACVPITLLALVYTFANLLRPHVLSAHMGAEDERDFRRLFDAQTAWRTAHNQRGEHLVPPHMVALVARHLATDDRLRGLAQVVETYRPPMPGDPFVRRLLSYAVEFVVLHEIAHVDTPHFIALRDCADASSSELSRQDFSWCAEIEADEFAMVAMNKRRILADVLEGREPSAHIAYESILWSVYSLFTLTYLIDLYEQDRTDGDPAIAARRSDYPPAGVRLFFLDREMGRADDVPFSGVYHQSWLGFVRCIGGLAEELGWTALLSAIMLPAGGPDDDFADVNHVAAMQPKFREFMRTFVDSNKHE